MEKNVFAYFDFKLDKYDDPQNAHKVWKLFDVHHPSYFVLQRSLIQLSMNLPFAFPSEGDSGSTPVDGHVSKPPVVPSRKFTLQELRKYNGCGRGEGREDDGEQPLIYVALLGYVYDVSRARHMYGPGMEIYE